MAQFDPLTGLTIEDEPQQSYEERLNQSLLGTNYFGVPSTVSGGDFITSKYDQDLYRFEDQYAQRAREQSKWAQLGNMLNQAIVGEIIGGTIEGVGYLLDFEQYGNLIEGTEQEFGNWFSDLGRGLKTWTQEVTPIYTDYKPGSFAPGNFSWWMSNAPSVASTLSLMIPSVGAVSGLSALAKGAGIAAKMGKAARWAGRGLTQAFMSRHMENIMEAAQTYEETEKLSIAAGKSAEEARQLAAIAASDSYNRNWVMIAQDIPQYLLLGRAFGKASSPATVEVGKRLGYDLLPIVGKKAAAIGWDMLGEFGEEAYQYVTAEESKYLVQRMLNPELDSSFGDRMREYIRDGELWTAGFFGALGAGAMQTAGRAINDAIAGTGHSASARRVAAINTFAPLVKYWNNQVREAEDRGDVEASADAKLGLVSSLAGQAVMIGGLGDAINFVETITKEGGPTQEDLDRFGLTEEDAKTMRDNFPDVARHLQEIGSLYDTNIKKFDSDIAAVLSSGEFIRKQLDNRRSDLESQIEQQKGEIVNYNRVSNIKRQLLENEARIRSRKKFIKSSEERLKKDPNLKDNEKGQADIENQIRVAQLELDDFDKLKKELDEHYTAEEKAKDAKYPIKGAELDKLIDLEGRLGNTEFAIRSYERQMDMLERGQKARRARIKEEPEPPVVPKPPTTEEEIPTAEVETTEDKAQETKKRQKDRKTEIKETTAAEDKVPDKRFVNINSRDLQVSDLTTAGPTQFIGFLRGEPGIFYSEEGQLKFKDNKTNTETIVDEETSTKTLRAHGAELAKYSLFNVGINAKGENIVITIGSQDFTIPIVEPYSAIKERNNLAESVTLKRADGKSVTFTAVPLVEELSSTLVLFDVAKNAVIRKYFQIDENKGARAKDPKTQKEYQVYRREDRWVVVDIETNKTLPADDDITKRVMSAVNADLLSLIEFGLQHVADISNKEELRNEIRKLVDNITPATPEQTNRSTDVSKVSDSKGVPEETTEQTAESVERGKQVEDKAIDEFAEERSKEEVAAEMAEEETAEEPQTIQGRSTVVEPLGPSESIQRDGQYYDTTEDQRHVSDSKNIVFGLPDSFVARWSPKFQEDLNKVLSNPETDIDNFSAEVEIGVFNETNKTFTVEAVKDNLSDEEIAKLDMRITLRDAENKVVSNDIYVPIAGDRIADDQERAHLLEHRKQIVSNALKNQPNIFKVRRTAGEPHNTGTNQNILKFLTSVGKELTDVDFAYGDSNRIPRSLHGLEDNLSHRSPLQLGPGDIAMLHNATPSGDYVASKLNPAKLGREYAQVLWKAFQTAAKKKSVKARYEGKEVTGGLTCHQVINTLTFVGPATKKSVENGATYLANKVVAYDYNKGNPFVEYSFDTRDGSTKKVYINKATDSEINDFINYIANNKNFSVDFSSLENIVEIPFTILGKKFEKGQTVLHEYLKNDWLQTDLGTFSGNSAYKSPLLIVDIGQRVEKPIVEPERAEKEPVFYQDDIVGKTVEYKGNEWKVISANPIFEEYDAEKEYLSAAESGEQDMAGAEAAFMDPEELERLEEERAKREEEKKAEKADFQVVLERYIEVKGTKKREEIAIDNSAGNKAAFNAAKIIGEEPGEEPGESFEDIFDDGIPLRHRSIVKNVQEKIDLTEELGWLREKLGNVSVLQFNEVVRMAIEKGKDIFGAFYNGSIVLLSDSAKGTVYHEAFHKVFGDFLTAKQQQRVLKEVRTRYSDELAAQYGDKELTDRRVEDFLAERFSEFVASDGEIKPAGPQARNWFQKLLDFIKAIVQFNRSEIDKLFDAIQRGDFRNRAETFTSEEQKTIVQNLAYLLLTTNNVDKFDNIKELDYGLVREHLKNRLEKFHKYAAKEENVKENPDKVIKATKLIDVYERILMEFDQFIGMTDDYLGTFNITRKDGDLVYKKREQDFVGDNEDESIDNEFERFEKAPYEVSAKDNALTEIKLLLATLPHGEITKTGAHKGLLDPLTGMRKFVDFNTMWADIIRLVHDAPTIEEMISRLEEKAVTSLPYHVLLNGLEKTNRLGLKTGPDSLRIKFFVTMRKHYNDFIDFRYTTNQRGDVVNAAARSSFVRTEASKYLNIWSQEMLTNSQLFNKTTTAPNKDFAFRLLDKYKQLLRDVRKEYHGKLPNKDTYEDLKWRIIGLYNNIGIPLDSETLDGYFENMRGSSQQKLHDFVVKKGHMIGIFGVDSLISKLAKGQQVARGQDILPPEKYLSNESNVRGLARAYANARPSVSESAVLGPGGNIHFTYSMPSPITDFISKLKSSPKFVDQLSSVLFNQNSQYLKQVREGAELGVHTFSVFTEENVGDTGRGYLEITDLEDFIFKLSFVMDDVIPLPTLADRKSFYAWTGLKKINFIGKTTIEKNKLRIPQEIIDIFEGYKRDEINTSREARRAVDEAIETEDYSKLVEGYHYKVGKNGLPIYKQNGQYTGTATNKFRHFDRGTSITQLIQNAIDDTFEYAKELGVISETNGIVLNRHLPKRLIDSVKEEFKTDDDQIAIRALIAEFTVNTMMSTIEAEKLLVGDAAFYKIDEKKGTVHDDRVKRIGVVAAAGDKVASNISNPQDPSLRRNKYTTVTFNTQNYVSKFYDELVEKHTARYKELGFEDSVASAMAKTKLAGYKEVDQTDAQVYISPEMYRQISMRLGEWSDEKQEAFELLESDKELTTEEEIRTLNVVMQPLKLVYFNLHFENGLAIPVYDKMSLATVFKKVAKGTQLEPMYNRMTDKKRPLDMVKFDSAVKAGNRQQINYFKRTQEGEDVVDESALHNSIVYEQFFDGLYRQVVTDPHEIKRQLLGTQMKKVSISNIVLGGEYVLGGKKVKGSDVVDAANKALRNLSNRGKRKLLERLGVNEDDPQIRDPENLVTMLRREAKLAGMPDNIVDALYVDENGELYVEFDALPDRMWIENRLMSIISKNTVDVKTAGGGFIQMSNFGLKKVNALKTSELKFYNDEGKMEIMVSVGLFRDVIPGYKEGKVTFEQARKWLKENLDGIGYRIPTQGLNSVIPFTVKEFLPENVGDTVVLPAEFTRLTGSDFDIDKLFIARYNYRITLNNEIQRIKFIDVDTSSKEGLTELYHERYDRTKNLLEKMDRVIIEAERDFEEDLERKGGDPEVVSLITAMMGEMPEYFSDAELDEILQEYNGRFTLKLYNEIKERVEKIPTLEEFIKENHGKDIYDLNNRLAVENRLLDAFTAVTTSPLHLIDNTTPLGVHTGTLKDISEVVKKAEGKDIKLRALMGTTPRFQSETKSRFTDSMGGIGPFALNNVHHSLGQIVKLGLKSANVLPGLIHYDEENSVIDLSQVRDVDKRVAILSWLSAFIDAHVDAAKDPYITDLNIGPATYNVANLLLRAGAGAEFVGYLLSQPIIKEYAKLRSRYDGNIGGNPNANINKIVRKKYWANTSKSAVENVDVKSLLTPSGLMKLLSAPKNSDWYAKQIALSRFFTELNSLSFSLNEAVQASQIDTKRYGSNIVQVRAFMNRFNRVIESDLVYNFDKLINESFLGTLLENSVDLAQDMLRNLTISSTDKFDDMMNSLLLQTGKKYSSDDKLINRYANILHATIISEYFTSPKGMGLTADIVKRMFFGKKSLARWIHAIQRGKTFPHLQNNLFIQSLTPVLSDKKEIPDTLQMLSFGKLDRWSKNSLSNAWLDLFNDNSKDSEKIRRLAMNLMAYSFIISGRRFGLNAFHQFLPIDAAKQIPQHIDEAISFSDGVKQIKEELQEGERDIDILRELYLNNWPDDSLVPSVSPVATKIAVEPKTNKSLNYPYLFTVAGNSSWYGTNHKGQPLYQPFVKIRNNKYGWLIGEYIGYRVDNEDNVLPVYKVVNKKGYFTRNIKVYEYNLDTSFETENNLPRLLSEAKEPEVIKLKGYENFQHVPKEDRIANYYNPVQVSEKRLEQPVSISVKKKMTMTFAGQFDNVISGKKTQTTRQNRNNYKVGDVVTIVSDDNRSVRARVTYVEPVNIEQIHALPATDSYFTLEGRDKEYFVKNTQYLKGKSNVVKIGFELLDESVVSQEPEQGKLFEIPVDTSKFVNVYAGAGENFELSNLAWRPFNLRGGQTIAMTHLDELLDKIKKMFPHLQNNLFIQSIDDVPEVLNEIFNIQFPGEKARGHDIYDIRFTSVEQFFQAMKFQWSTMSDPKNKELLRQIMTTKKTGEIKKLGRQFTLEEQADWNEVAFDLMKFAVYESFNQNIEAKDKLLATGSKKITHVQDKTRWKEDFPEILEEVRFRLARDLGPYSKLPIPIDYEQRIGAPQKETSRLKEILALLNKQDLSPEERQGLEEELHDLYYKDPTERVTIAEKRAARETKEKPSRGVTKESIIKYLRDTEAMNTKEFKGFDNWIKIGRDRSALPASRRVIFKLNKKYEKYGKLITLIPRNDSWLIQINQDVIDKLNAREQRVTKGEPLTRAEFEEQRQILQKTFPGVRIVEDFTLDIPGKLMSGGEEIHVNPVYWLRDTLGHEFGHLLIDLIGGVNNRLVRQGLRFLDGTDLQKDVYNKYSDLIERGEFDRVQKEVLAQAVGLEAAKIFKEEFEMGRWERWLVRFFRRIRQLLGIESSAVRKLAKTLVRGTPVKAEDLHGQPSTYEQEQRIDPKEAEDVLKLEEEPETDLNKIRKKAIEALEKKIGIYQQRGKKAAVEAIEKGLNEVQEGDNPYRSIRRFIEVARRQTNSVIQDIHRFESEAGLGIEEDPFNADRLSKWKDYVAAYANVLYDIRNALIELKNAPIEVGDKFRKGRDIRMQARIEEIDEILANKTFIERLYVRKGVNIVSKFLAPYSTRIAGEYKEALERRWNRLSKKEKEETPLEEYQAKYLAANDEQIKLKTEESIRKELLKAEWDINFLGRWLDNLLDSPDLVVQAMVKKFSLTDEQSRYESIGARNRIVAAKKKLEKFLGSMADQTKFYGFMLERDKKTGLLTQHYVTPYLSSMWDEYNDKVTEWTNDPDISDLALRAKKESWINENYGRSKKDKIAYNKARAEYLRKMKEEGQLTDAEWAVIDSWEANRNSRYSFVLREHVREETAEKYFEFLDTSRWEYRTPAERWRNPQWKKLLEIADIDPQLTETEQRELLKLNENKDPRIEFYNLIVELSEEADKMLPYRFRLRGKLPAIAAKLGERVLRKQKPSTIAREETRLGLVKRPEDIEKGQLDITNEAGDPINFVPIFYTYDIEPQNQSYDIATIYQRYWSMARDYSLKSEILPEMEMAKYFVENREVLRRDERGNIIKDGLSRIGDRMLTKKGVQSFVSQQLGDWFKSIIYGQRVRDEGVLPLFGANVDIAKGADLLNRYTSFNLLGLNMVQGVANVLLGETMQWAEAFGGEYYGVKDFVKAGVYYTKNLPGILGDIGERVPTNIISLINEEFNTLNEYENGEYRKNSKFQQLMSSNTLFFTTHAGEHLMQTRVVLAMLNRMRAKDKNGKDMGTMLDNLTIGKDGRLDVKEGVANFGREKRAKFGLQARRILSAMHGEYSRNGMAAVQRYALGRLGIMFRKFVVPGFKRRYAKKKYNELLEGWTEGNYRTTGRFFRNLMKDLRIFRLAAWSEEWTDLTRMEKGNIRKTMAEVVFLATVIIMSTIFIGKMEGEDDDEEWLWSFMAYQALRLRTELLFFSPKLNEALRILRSPAASMSVVENIINLTSQMFDPFERYERGNWKGKPKITKTMINFVPGVRQVYRMKYVNDQISWFRN